MDDSTITRRDLWITTSEDIEETFIYRDVPIKNLKRCTKAGGPAMTLITLNLVNNSDRPELSKGVYQ